MTTVSQMNNFNKCYPLMYPGLKTLQLLYENKERIFILFPNLRLKVNSGHGRKIWQVLKLHRIFWQKLVYLRVNQPEAYKLGDADAFYKTELAL